MDSKDRLKRREFIANILFAGGALSLASLDGVVAGPIEDGWELPDDWKNSAPPPKRPKPRPKPPKPRPPVDGGVRPPRPPGGIRPPQPRGIVRPPRPKGD